MEIQTKLGDEKQKMPVLFPDTFVAIMAAFYELPDNTSGLSITGLAERFNNKMHINTIKNHVNKMRQLGLIQLKWKGVGQTHSRKTYILTTKGELLYESW
jgi:predicted transcriptional regulator